MMVLDQNVGHTFGQTRSERAVMMVRDLHRLGIPVKIGMLNSGDAYFQGQGPGGEVSVGVELKTVNGLLGDLITGRFVGRQIPEMQKDYQYRYLILEGAFRPASDGILEVPRGGGWVPASPRLMYIDFVKWLDDIDLRAGFHLRRTWNSVETMHALAAEYLGWQKPWDKHKGLNHFHNPQPGVVLLRPPTLARLWARDLPGVGWERSEGAERHFRSPLQLAQAPESEWRLVPGIGKTIAARVWKAIRGLK